jgi:hypothetical protein
LNVPLSVDHGRPVFDDQGVGRFVGYDTAFRREKRLQNGGQVFGVGMLELNHADNYTLPGRGCLARAREKSGVSSTRRRIRKTLPPSGKQPCFEERINKSNFLSAFKQDVDVDHSRNRSVHRCSTVRPDCFHKVHRINTFSAFPC